MDFSKLARVTVVASAAALIGLSACSSQPSNPSGAPTPSASSTSQPFQLAVTNPYILLEQPMKVVGPGTSLGPDGCKTEMKANCARAKLDGQALNAMLVPYGNFRNASLTNTGLVLASIDHADFTDANLSKANLSGATGADVNLSGSNLSNSTIVLGDFPEADFDGANMQDAVFTSTGAVSASFVGTNFKGANLWAAELAGANLTGATMSGADLSNADLTRAKVSDSQLKDAVLCNTVMPDGRVENPQPSGCPNPPTYAPADTKIEMKPDDPYYTGASYLQKYSAAVLNSTIGNCNLKPLAQCPGANLDGQTLSGFMIPGMNLAAASLRGTDAVYLGGPFVDLSGAQMGAVNLSAASMTKVNLSNSDLSNSTLALAAMAYLTAPGADFTNASMKDAVLSGSNLQGATFSGADLEDSLFVAADLRGADLSGADLSDANLAGAKLDGAKLDGTKFCNTLMPDGTYNNPSTTDCQD